MIRYLVLCFFLGCTSGDEQRGYSNLTVISHKAFHNTVNPEIFFNSNNRPCVHAFRKDNGADFDFSKSNFDKAFEYGADYVEVDTRLTKDRVIFATHDKKLDCLTNLSGNVSDYNYLDLRTRLAPNHNVFFEKNGKKVFPFKNKGIGEILKLEELFEMFPKKGFLINPKDKEFESFKPYLELFKNYPHIKIKIWGPSRLFVEAQKHNLKNVSEFISNHHQSKKCLEAYRNNEDLSPCEGLSMSLSIRDSKRLSGWPELFLKEMKKNNAKAYMFLPELTQEEEIIEALSSDIEGVIVSDIKAFHEKFLNK